MIDSDEIKSLKQENKKLRSQLQAIADKKDRKKGVWFWLIRKSSVPLLGAKLKGSIQTALSEYKEEKTVSVDTLSNVISHLIWRLTRIGLFAFIVAVIPVLILVAQTWLVTHQNELIGNQNTLIEAERRSSLVFVMDNVLSDLSLELEKSRDKNISPVLEARIASLSRAMKPYNFIDIGGLTEKEISPERGQLLYSLVNSKMGSGSFSDIMIASDFSASYFKDVYLGRNANLKNAKLSYSDMTGAQLAAVNLERSELKHAEIRNANLSDANLKEANLYYAKLQNTELLSADLTFANLEGTDLTNADLSEAKLWGTKLKDAVLKNTVLDNAIVDRKDWFSYITSFLEIEGGDALSEKYKLKKEGEKQYIIILK